MSLPAELAAREAQFAALLKPSRSGVRPGKKKRDPRCARCKNHGDVTSLKVRCRTKSKCVVFFRLRISPRDNREAYIVAGGKTIRKHVRFVLLGGPTPNLCWGCKGGTPALRLAWNYPCHRAIPSGQLYALNPLALHAPVRGHSCRLC